MSIPFGGFILDPEKLAIALAVAWVGQWLGLTLLDRLFHRHKWLHANEHVFLLRPALLACLTLLALDISIRGLDFIAKRLYIVSGVWLATRAVKLFKWVTYARFDASHEDNLRARKMRTQVEFLERTVNVVLIFFGFALLLMTFEEVRSIGGSLIASAGIAGVVLGFAAQKSLGTFISGFQIAFTQPIRLDDVVLVEGEWGTIEEITLTYVVVKLWDLRRLIVPIHFFTDQTFQNWTRTEARLLSYVYLNFDYSLDCESLRREFNAAVKASKLWDGRVNVLQVSDASEKTIQVRLLMSARNSADSYDLRCEVREKMIAFVQKNQPSALPKIRLHDESQRPERSGDRFE